MTNTNITGLLTRPDTPPILQPEFADLIQKPISENSLAYDPRLTTLVGTSAEELRFPILEEDTQSGWVSEGYPISEDNPTISEVRVRPSKVAGLTLITNELKNDSAPAALQIAGDSLARSLAKNIDTALVGNLQDPAPAGLGSLTDATELTGTLTDLDLFVDALSALEAQGTQATAFLLNPQDASTLRKMKATTTGVAPALGTDVTAGISTELFGVPVLVSSALDHGTAYAVNKQDIITVQRNAVEITVDTSWRFAHDSTAIRATSRIGFAFPKPKNIVRMTITTGEK